MREPKSIRGARAPLFDRLVDAPDADHVLDLEGLKKSVIREINTLVNTRCASGEDRNGTVIDFGIPSFSHVSSAVDVERSALAATIGRKIETFEPRLRSVRVVLEQDSSSPFGLIGTIEGVLRSESVTEPVSFGLAFNSDSGILSVAEFPTARRAAASS